MWLGCNHNSALHWVIIWLNRLLFCNHSSPSRFIISSSGERSEPLELSSQTLNNEWGKNKQQRNSHLYSLILFTFPSSRVTPPFYPCLQCPGAPTHIKHAPIGQVCMILLRAQHHRCWSYRLMVKGLIPWKLIYHKIHYTDISSKAFWRIQQSSGSQRKTGRPCSSPPRAKLLQLPHLTPFQLWNFRPCDTEEKAIRG